MDFWVLLGVTEYFIQDASSQMMLDLLKAEVLSAILAVFALICCEKNSSIGN